MPESAAERVRMLELVRAWEPRVERAAAGTPEDRVDRAVLALSLRIAAFEVRQQERRAGQWRDALPFHAEIEKVLAPEWGRGEVDPEVAARTLGGLAEEVKTLRRRIEAGRAKAGDAPKTSGSAEAPVEPLNLTPARAARAAGVAGALKDYLAKWFEARDGADPEFGWWLRKPVATGTAALAEYAKFLKEEIAGVKEGEDPPLLGEPVGADVIAEALRLELIPYRAEELIAIAEKDFAWCEGEMRANAKAMGFDDWKAALEKVKGSRLEPGAHAEAVKREAERASKWVQEKGLITVPPLCDELWSVRLLTADEQKTVPYASYGSGGVNVAQPQAAMTTEEKIMALRGNNLHFLRNVIPHEVIPGHHLQIFVGQRENPHRRDFNTAFLIEGWCLYWEMRLLDLGYHGLPEDRIGALFWRMQRGARVILTLKYHLGQITPEAMADFLVERVGNERSAARSEVRRYVGSDYVPLYQVAYLIGGLQVRALHAECVGGKKMSEREFHDRVLAQNAIPVALIRAALTGSAPSLEPEWRFADPAPAGKTK
jgi:hypothetical protein